MIEYITEKAIQSLFNNSEYPEMITAGTLKRTLLKRSHLQNPDRGIGPYCTHSESHLYTSNDGQQFVIVHQYVRPDGTLGASGKPDPKKIKLEDRIYVKR